MTTFVTLPREMVVNDTVLVQHWRTKHYVVYQNYTTPIAHGGELLPRYEQTKGQNQFHVFRVIQHEPGEELGEKLATYSDLQPAMTFIEKEEDLA